MSSSIDAGIKCKFAPLVLRLLSDRKFLEYRYKYRLGKKLNLDNPQSFNEKLQYLNLYFRPEIAPFLVDKFGVRKIIVDRGLGSILNELYGVYGKVEEIDLAALPDDFVIRMTHGSGWNIFCLDKTKMDWETEFKKIRKWLKTNYYNLGREWVYKSIKPRILVEKYLRDSVREWVPDYKIHCFKGIPLFAQVDLNRYKNHTQNYFDLEWQPLPFRRAYPNSNEVITKPPNLADMISISEKLSRDLIYDRVDLYSVGGITIFGEITFFPDNGLIKFFPEEYEYYWGSKIDLTSV